MGRELARAALDYPRLNHRSARVLARMALDAVDPPGSPSYPPSIYYGGWEALARALGRDVPSEAQARAIDGARRSRETSAKLVQRVMVELIETGLVERIGKAHGGRSQHYRLNLSPTVTVPQSPTVAVSQTGNDKPHRDGPPKAHRDGPDSPTVTVPPQFKEL